MKINRDLLTLLLVLDMRDRKISEFLGVSKTTLYNYLQKYPVSDEEKKVFLMDMSFYLGHFWQIILNIKSGLPEINSNEKQANISPQIKSIQNEKNNPKTMEIEFHKKSDEIQKMKDDKKGNKVNIEDLENFTIAIDEQLKEDEDES